MDQKQRESMASSEADSRRRESMAESEGTDEVEDDAAQNEDDDKARRVKKIEYVKQYNFVDDNTFYERRINFKDVNKYWRWLVAHHYYPRLNPNFVSWLEQSRHVDYSLEVKFYPVLSVVFLRTATHYYWDYAYLWLGVIFLVLLGLHVDQFLDDYYVIDAATVAFPLLLMVVVQTVPVAGAVVGVVYMNDLAKFLANAQIDRWAVNAVLVGQYIEFAYYGGHSRLDMASKCRLENTRSNTMKFSMKDPLAPTFAEKFRSKIEFLLRLGRPARVAVEEEDEEDEGGVSYYLNDEGKMVYIDDDGNEVELTQEDMDLLLEAEKEETSVLESIEGSQVSKNTFGSQVSYQSRAASRLSDPASGSSRDVEQGGVDEWGNNKKLSAAEKLRRKKDKLRLLKEAEEALAEEDEESVADGVELGKGGGFMQRREAELKAAQEEALRLKMDRKMKEEEGCTDWWEWDCVICKNYNRRPRELEPSYDTTFVTKGVFFKHTVISLRPTSLVPTCERCHTPADYEPRLCNKHFINGIPEPHAAFENYPESVPRLPRHFLLRAYDVVVSFFFGRRNHPDSKLMANDWRLSIYLSSMFPEIQRHSKKPEEYYLVGEIVECKLQKSDWCRARIIDAKLSRAYDIKYDSGDVVRLVDEKALRLPPAKGWFAYRLELVLVGLLVGFPLGLFLAVSSQDPGLAFLPMLIGCAILLTLRVVAFAKGFSEYYTAGCLVLSVQAAIFLLPLFFFVIGSLLGMNATSLGLPWMSVSIMIIIGLVLSLPYLYMKRVTFAYRLLPVIFLFALGTINAAIRLDGEPIDVFCSATIAPSVVLLLRLMKFRTDLGSIWDVSLIIRPISDAQFEPMWIMKQISKFMDKFKGKNSTEEEEEFADDELGMGGVEDAGPTNLTSIKTVDEEPETKN